MKNFEKILEVEKHLAAIKAIKAELKGTELEFYQVSVQSSTIMFNHTTTIFELAEELNLEPTIKFSPEFRHVAIFNNGIEYIALDEVKEGE